MSPKRRGTQAMAPAQPGKPSPPAPPKPPPPSKQASFAPAPPPAHMPPPPPPVESGAARVRKEWSRFVDAWYEPQKKKLVDKLQKDLLVKYKDLGPPKETQKLREMELYEKFDSLAQQLAQPARVEWERRLELAQLREDQWDDMTGEEQQEVLGVFVGFFSDDVEDMDHDDDVSANPSSIEEDSIIEEPQHRPPQIPPPLSRQAIPPTPTRGNFEFVNPTSFFIDTMTPPNPTRSLPALPMDHLATLGPSNSARSAETANGGAALGFQTWASEAGIVTQQPQSLSSKPPPPFAPPSAQTLSARPRAVDMSRQASAASYLSSPLSKTSSPQYSPPVPTKLSPPINSESLPLGKRYIGPVITEEEPDPMDEELLKSKMADDYQQYKISLRIQMIYQFHSEAADIEIKLFESLLAVEGTKESRARAVQEHEASMMHLREQKEEERKRLCAEEREKRRREMRQQLAQRRSPLNREVDPGPKATIPAPLPDKTSFQQRPVKATHQKENIPLPPPVSAPSAKVEPPSVIKKSNSTLSQGEAAANEALFSNAMAMLSHGKPGATGLTPAQASLNEATFSNAAAMLTTQPHPEEKSTLPPSIMKKPNSSRSRGHDVPQITVSLAEPPIPNPVPELAQVPPTIAKGKKGRKGQPTAQPPPAKPITVMEQPEIDTEPPPPVPSLWDAATVVAKNAWGVASASISPPKPKPNASAEADGPADQPTPAPSKSTNAKKAGPSAKKGKKVTITEELDVDADPIVSPPPTLKTTSTKGAWGSVNGKSKATPPPVIEESKPEPAPQPPLATSARGKKMAQAANKPSLKPQLKVSILEEQESEIEQNPAPSRTGKPKSAWSAPALIPGANTVVKTATQQQLEPHRGTTAGSKPIRMDSVPDPEAESLPDTMPGGSMETEEERGPSDWFNPENMNYWANFMAGQTEAEEETVPEAPEQTGRHVRWTPTVNEESDDEGELEDLDEQLATSMWMQYAISGGGVPSLSGPPEVTPFENTQHGASLWEQGIGKKKSSPATGDAGNRGQQTSAFDKAALTGQWPKVESWLSPPARGQSSGSARVF